MPKSTECIIGIDLAIALRNLVDELHLEVPKGELQMRCTECGRPVKPHFASAEQAAHFEHLKRNAKCSLSHVARN